MRIGPETGAVISGGASGLGAATARMLAAAGAQVGILDRDAKAGAALAAELGGTFLETDVSDPQSVASALERFAGRATLRIAVCCAGIAQAGKTVDRDGAGHDPALFDRTVAVNLTGSFNLASQAAAIMARQSPLGEDDARGVIVMTASIAAYEGQIGQVAYAASKGGVAAMVLPMARDLARMGIRVNAIAPGLFATPMVAGLPQEVQDALGAGIPYPSRLGRPEEYASLVAEIIRNPMLNGTTIRLDGAFRMPPR